MNFKIKSLAGAEAFERTADQLTKVIRQRLAHFLRDANSTLMELSAAGGGVLQIMVSTMRGDVRPSRLVLQDIVQQIRMAIDFFSTRPGGEQDVRAGLALLPLRLLADVPLTLVGALISGGAQRSAEFTFGFERNVLELVFAESLLLAWPGPGTMGLAVKASGAYLVEGVARA